ncbi:hypothetical protein GCM10011505_26270 [Tistrella bauzanensis]|uniref:Hemin uptake protein HemP n=1 Tax=Tistrella bauzanensis TaxID=657419 RepID=A0ABQ1IJJ6_9PROT|nr:hemin uptake protein HemP [Tistrella bauzanensis]GGB43700.1 hypothetical protein GCM10011505_26270 [Tistrella bauzanensis]
MSETAPAGNSRGPHGASACCTGHKQGGPTPPSLDSMALLGAAGEVLIAHCGETYRLRRTRQNKLILTK